LPIAGSDAAGVHYLRVFDDASALNSALVEGSSLAVVGAGWIGLEVAASARQRGVNVTVVEAAELPLIGALGAEVGAVFATLHREHGVDLRLRSQVEEITTADGKATGLRLADGTSITADAVLVAVGAQPNVELADQAGLSMGDGGVLVDASLRTSEPDIYAVGDIAAAEHPLLGGRIRTEHWANALKQPAVAAAGMLGEQAEYAELPYFFTDQYDLGMEYAGHAPTYDRVVFRGDVDGREFIAFWLDADNRVLAGMNVNIWDVLDDIKILIRSKRAVDLDKLADPHAPLGELIN
jgi:3-phenylpropionate/trans-cinnamate dioxygenase ferredoxin reductase subunit